MAKKKRQNDAEKRYTREALLRDSRFSGVQRDFLQVILKNPFYTIKEAEESVSHFFGKD